MISATMFITVAALQRSKSEAWENFLEGKEYSLPGYLIVDVTDLLIPEGDYNAIGPLPEGSGAIVFSEMRLELSEGETVENESIEVEERLGELKKEYLDGDDSGFEPAKSSENIKFQEAAPDYRIHEVQQGETLETIVKRYAEYGISVEDIAKANQISNIHKLNIGDVLLIPTSKEKVEVVLKELLSRRAKAEEEAKKLPK